LQDSEGKNGKELTSGLSECRASSRLSAASLVVVGATFTSRDKKTQAMILKGDGKRVPENTTEKLKHHQLESLAVLKQLDDHSLD